MLLVIYVDNHCSQKSLASFHSFFSSLSEKNLGMTEERYGTLTPVKDLLAVGPILAKAEPKNMYMSVMGPFCMYVSHVARTVSPINYDPKKASF